MNCQVLYNQKFDFFAKSISDEREKAIWEERLLADKPKSLKNIGDQF